APFALTRAAPGAGNSGGQQAGRGRFSSPLPGAGADPAAKSEKSAPPLPGLPGQPRNNPAGRRHPEWAETPPADREWLPVGESARPLPHFSSAAGSAGSGTCPLAPRPTATVGCGRCGDRWTAACPNPDAPAATTGPRRAPDQPAPEAAATVPGLP